MDKFGFARTSLAVLVCTLLIPAAALAQTGAIAGAVTDETGGVLPGVTVEATSPALIEGVRATVTDGAGLYTIEALRPGTYTVTFTLTGFSTFVRDGIELTSDFTANVDGRMTVGSIEETITVSGASPLIDVQNVVSQATLSREEIDTLPTSKTYFGLAALTPGMSANISGGGHDVGGTVGDIWGYVTIHGSSTADGMVMWDGMSINNNISNGGGSSKEFFLNQAAIQEMVVSTSDMSAEYPFGGVATNAIPKEGGNSFSYYVNVSGTNGDLQSANVDEALEARGASPLAKNRKVWDYGVGVGGPILNDRVWFYTAHRWWGAQNFQPKGNVNLTPHSPFYTPDPDDAAWTDFYNQDNSIRFTIQASERHKVTLSQAFQTNCACHYWTQWGLVDMDATVDYTYWPINLSQATWTFPASNRLLFEAGGSFLTNNSAPRRQAQVRPDDVAHVTFADPVQGFFNWQAFGVNPCAPCLYGTAHNFPTQVFRASMSYVTGSHNFKVGVDTRRAEENHGLAELNNPLRYDFFTASFPLQVTQFATPRVSFQTSNDLGIYAQDQWTIDRLTLNLGVRYDHVNAYVPVQSNPVSRFVRNPVAVTAPIENVPNYHDITPRLGVSYDLFGDGRTAIKATWGRYIMAVGTSIAQTINPLEAIQVSSSRSWGDLPFQGGNGNFVPDCDFDNFAANGECGPIRDPEFGTSAIVQSYDPDLLEGWGKRPYNWQNSVSIQHELFPGWSLEVGWFRTAYGNFRVADNLNIGPEHFSEFSIVAAEDPRLGPFSGATIGGLYTITPEGQALGSSSMVTLAKNIPGGDAMRQVFNGMDVNFTGRFDNGIFLGGGFSTGSTAFNECFVVDNPMRMRPGYCDVAEPWAASTQLKFNGAVPLPYDTEFSFVFQNLAGLPWESVYRAGASPAERAAIEAQIGHPMVVGAETIQLFPSGVGIGDLTGIGGTAPTSVTRGSDVFFFTGSQFYEPRLTQLDIRFTKILNFGRARVRAWIDLFNLFNANSASSISDAYTGAQGVYPIVNGVMGGRLLKFGAQFDF